MNTQDVDRYRGSCLVVNKPRLRGAARGRLFESRPRGPMGLWQAQRLGPPLGQVAPPPNMLIFSERNSPLVGAPIYSYGPYPFGRGAHLHHNGHDLCPHRWPNRWGDQGFSPREGPTGLERDNVDRLSRLAINVKGDPPTSGGESPEGDEREGSLSPPNSSSSSSSDAVSVGSDEGGCSNSLPRIIKPRKRRKKDRKPPSPQGTTPVSEKELPPSKTLVTLKPYGPPREGSSSPMLFPTPPSSPSIASEDEMGFPVWHHPPGRGDSKDHLVRSFSAPHFQPPLRGGHPAPLMPSPTQGPGPPLPPPRSRHLSTPCLRRYPVSAFARNLSEPYVGGRASDPAPLDRPDALVRTPTPAEREWVQLSEPNPSRPACLFTVMCYNVLCDKYATRQMYGYCPPWALEWNYRKKGIMDEIRRYSADIITLQEVETDQFFKFFLPELKKDGYVGIFSPKSRAKHMSESERKYVDGCAIFWRTNKFTLAKEHLIEFNQLAMANHDGSEDMLNRVMTKDNIGLAALLHTTEAAWGDNVPDKSNICQSILVCTAHIHWDPEFCDVKLIQTIMLMSEVRTIVNQILEESRGRGAAKLDLHDIHLLLCGDLNSLPDSGVVEFLTKGSVSMEHTDFKGLGYKTPLQKIALSKNHNSGLVNTSANIHTHSFRLAATYDFTIMPYTNYTYDFKGIIDYIFHSCNGIRTLGVLGPVDPEWFNNNKVLGCPHPHIPSDHFPLLVELELQPPTSSHPNGLLHR